MVHVGIPQLAFQAMIALAIGLEIDRGYAQEQVVARPYGFRSRQGTPPGTYMFMGPGQSGGPMYAIADGVPGMTPETVFGQYGRGFSGDGSAFILDNSDPRAELARSPPSLQILQAPSQQPAQQQRSPSVQVLQVPAQQSVQLQPPVRAVSAAAAARMMRQATGNPPTSVQAAQAPVQASVQRVSPVAPAPQFVAPAPAPAVQAQAYQAPVQRSAQILPLASSSEVAPVPVRGYQVPVQRARQSIAAPGPAPAPAPARATQPARQPAPVLVRAPPDSDARVTIAQAIPTQIPTGRLQTYLSSIANEITGTQTGTATSPTNTASPTDTATTGTTTNELTTTTNGRTTTTTGRFTTPTLIPGSAVSLTGGPDRLLIAMVLGFVGIEIFAL